MISLSIMVVSVRHTVINFAWKYSNERHVCERERHNRLKEPHFIWKYVTFVWLSVKMV